MAQKHVNKALGLHTFKNELTVQDGALSKADNVIIDRDGIIESRRGFNLGNSFGQADDRAKQILQYKDKLLIHFDNTLLYCDDTSLVEFDGTYEDLSEGLRIKGLETSGNFYFTTNDGIKKISAVNSTEFNSNPNYITDAGAVRGLDVNGKATYDDITFIEPNSTVAYRMVWGYKDKNSNLILGYPSEVAVIRNSSLTEYAGATLEITIPAEITSINPLNYFYQIYRSSQKSDIDGYNGTYDTEFQLVAEDFPIDQDFTNGYVTYVDIVSEGFRAGGANLYTNEISGEGILKANSRPPLATDIAYFKGSTFYSNTSTKHNYLLSVSSLDNISNTSKLYIANSDQVTDYTFYGIQEKSEIDGSGFGGNAASLNGTYFFINTANNNRECYVWWNDGSLTEAPSDTDTVGKMDIEVDISGSPGNPAIGNALISALNNFNAGVDFLASYRNNDENTGVVEILNVNTGEATAIDDTTLSPMGNGITTQRLIEGFGEDSLLRRFHRSIDPSTGIAIEEVASSIAKIINKQTNEVVTCHTLNDETSISGELQFISKSATDDKIFFATNDPVIADNFTPTLPIVTEGLSISTDSINNKATITYLTPHNLSVGDNVVIMNSSSANMSPNGSFVIESVTATTITVSMISTSDTVATIDIFKGSQSSDNEKKQNRVYYSKDGIPEAVPILNYFDVGSKDSEILRIVALRDSLFILKTDGIFRLSGTDEANFNVTLFDASSPLIAADSPAILNNQIYMLSSQGVVAVTEGGVDIISRDIERDILEPTSNNYNNFSTQTFGIASESDRSYMLWLPTETDDEYATQCYRFNIFTRSWTRWDMSKTCGKVNTNDDKIYLGASDTNYIEKERKNFKRSDYADRQYDNFINNMSDSLTVELAQIQSVDTFDAIYQEQYLTIDRFNRLLERLDNDILLSPTTNDKIYLSTYQVTTGADLATQLSILITEVNSRDSEQTYTASSGDNTITTLRDDFNLFMTELNASQGTFYSNYRSYTDLVQFESIIKGLNKYVNEITLLTETPLVIGTVIIFKAINCFIEYAPETLGDASLKKQFREGTLMFDQFDFSFGEMGFRSDISDSYEGTLFNGEGTGDYGSQVYGEYIYGGLANQRPFRTYIPRNKQRCRMIIISFTHVAARESFKLNGYSVTYNSSTSERAYKR